MRSGICPKCGSTEVHTRFGGIFRGQTRSIVVAGGLLGSTRATSDDYVCTDCGYFEQYFTKGRALNRIARKWPLVSELVPEDGQP
ncbi:transposase-like protein [Streptacidiphilus sp. MAP12-33]